MSKSQIEPGSSSMTSQKDEEDVGYRSRINQKNRKGSFGGGRGFKRRGTDRCMRGKRWRGSGGSEELPFLCGGNINDPLNLESVKPEEDDGEGLEPLEIIIPKNPRDPLNLKKTIKNRNKRKRRNSKLYGEEAQSLTADGTARQRCSSASEDKPPFDPIVSPVPASIVRKFSYKQPVKKQKTSEGKDPNDERIVPKNANKNEKPQEQQFSGAISKPAENKPVDSESVNEKKAKMNERFRYGNFDRYYGCRIERSSGKDPRISAFKKEWFEKKAVLDIGCNAGYVTLWIAKEFLPKRIVGIDIDPHLVGVARKNIRHYCDKSVQIQGNFPASFAHRYGPISAPPVHVSTKFPDNVWFRQENYVLECDEYLDAVKEEFDVILALSITKWIHLNWGDDGLKRFFKRIFAHLRPGGRLILEPQDFKSYYKRARMTAETLEVFKTLNFLPESFQDYLLKDVGFESFENIDAPKAVTKGFERPIQVYKKKMSFSSEPPSKTCKIVRNANNADLEQRHSPKRPKLIKFED